MFGPVVQIAYVVADPAVAAAQWCERHGAGPFFLRQHIPVTHVLHRGVPSSFDHTSAYGWMPSATGGMMIELFVQHDRASSAVTERFAVGEGGLHHLACLVPDLDAALGGLERRSMSVAMTATASTTRFAFVDDRIASGHYWELYEPTARLLDFYEMVRTASSGWDGSQLVREL